MPNERQQSLVAFLNSDINERNNNLPAAYHLESGCANGYVAVLPGHPLYGKSFMDFTLNVHGGVTFTDHYGTVKRNFKSIEYIDDALNVSDDWWVIGFDTCHFDDSLERWAMAIPYTKCSNSVQLSTATSAFPKSKQSSKKTAINERMD